MEFEDILVKVGNYGNYQKKLLLLFLFPSSAILPWFSMNIFFMLSVPDHWCHVPELAATNLSIAERQSLIRPSADPKCLMYDVNYTEILSSSNWTIPSDAKTKSCDHGWEYDQTHYTSTAASKWNMVCENGHYVSLVFATTEIGSIIGSPMYGALSDRFGRKPIFFLTVMVTAIAATTGVLMSEFIAFVIMRTIDGTIMPSIFQLPYIILLELVGPEKRTRMNGIANSSWTVGLCILPLIAWLARDWKTLGLLTCSTSLIFLVYWRILPESPRWLVSREKYDEAADALVQIAKRNGRTVDREELLVQLKKLGEQAKEEEDKTSKMSSSLILKYPQLRKKFLIVTYSWIAEFAAYYGLQLNVSNLGGNEFLNFFMLAVAELPGYFCSWYLMEKIGRRWCSVGFLCLTGFACMMPFIIPEEVIAGAIVSSLIAKFGASAAFMTVYQQSAELYPTVIRSLGMGLSSTIAAAVNIAIPYVVYLSRYGKYIPFLIISFICFTAGFGSSFLPETLNESLPQTIEDAEEFGKNQKYFSCNKRRRPSCYEKQSEDIAKVQSNIEKKKAEVKV